MEQNEKAECSRFSYGKVDIQADDALDGMLKSLYASETVPDDINIRLQNQIKYKTAMEENGMHIWWLPASLSTVLAVAGMALSLMLYYIIMLAGVDATMPFLLRFVAEGFLKIQFAIAFFQAAVSWLMTFVGLWKLNLYQSARL